MVESVVVTTAEHRELVRVFLQVRKRIRDRDARLPAVREVDLAAEEQLLGHVGELRRNLSKTLRHFLPGELVEQRLRVERLHLARATGHHEEDDVLRLRGE